MTIPDIVGNAGVACILGSYLAAQTDRLDPRGNAYLVVNGVGSALVLYSLLFAYNQSAFVIQCAWIAISVVGLTRNAIGSRQQAKMAATATPTHEPPAEP